MAELDPPPDFDKGAFGFLQRLGRVLRGPPKAPANESQVERDRRKAIELGKKRRAAASNKK